MGKYRVAREVGTDKFVARAPVTMMPGDIKKRAEDALNTQVGWGGFVGIGRNQCITRSFAALLQDCEDGVGG